MARPAMRQGAGNNGNTWDAGQGKMDEGHGTIGHAAATTDCCKLSSEN
jgi:hypothetical protein